MFTATVESYAVSVNVWPPSVETPTNVWRPHQPLRHEPYSSLPVSQTTAGTVAPPGPAFDVVTV